MSQALGREKWSPLDTSTMPSALSGSTAIVILCCTLSCTSFLTKVMTAVIQQRLRDWLRQKTGVTQ